MHREYVKWYSPRLGRDMEMLIFGDSGTPVLLFPTSMGRFYDYENRGIVDTLGGPIEAGDLQLFCVDSVDSESWYNRGIHPADRVSRHVAYDGYVADEVTPLMRQRSGHDRIAVTGASFGGYHCTNFALRHPDLVCRCVAMSGAYDIHQFLDGHYDENAYFNCPADFLPNNNDPWYLDQFRTHIGWIFGVGEHDICLGPTRRISGIFDQKGIPHWFDCWGLGAVHDWPLWHLMAAKYFG